MKMKNMIRGTGVAIVTPFQKSGKIDFKSLANLIEHIIVNKVEFVVALGTTSEAVTLTASEKIEVMDYVIEYVDGRIPIVMGIGGNNTQAVLNTLKSTDFDEISAILSVAPYYNKPNQTGLFQHFSAIAKACPVDVILYNVPGRTSSNISADTVLKLANAHSNIVAVKEASGDFSQIMDIIRKRPEGFAVLSGDDALTYPMMALGADGVISVVANAYPATFSAMVRMMLKKKFDEALEVHYSLLDIINQLFADGNPAGVKAALTILGMSKNYLRLPMVPVNKEVYARLKKLIDNYETPF
jgi:4-hydroxy-tetrahydrodipicolinate synthase